MRTSRWGLAIALLIAVLLGSGGPASADPDLAEILDHVDDLYSGQSSHSLVVMHVVTEHAVRDLSMESWSKSHDKVLVRILAPEKEQGTATLKNGNNVWNYFPKINQVMKVSPSLMSASWMGSHVTNSEIVRRARMSEDYTYTKTFDGLQGGERLLALTLIPKPSAAVVWGKVVVTVRASDWNPTRIEYFDEAKILSQTWLFADIKGFGGRNVPSTLKIVPADKPAESTEVRYQSIQFDLPLDDSLFSQRTLQR